MRIKISLENILISTLCFLYIFEYTLYGQSISGLKYIVQALCIFLFFCKNRKDVFIIPRDSIVVCLIIIFGIIPLGQTFSNINMTIGVYTLVMWLFLLCTYCLGKHLNTEEKKQEFVRKFATIGTIIVLVCFILNYSNLFNIRAILSNFRNDFNVLNDIEKRERSGFGFMHVNSLGGICVVLIIALFIIKCRNPKYLIARNIAIAFVFLVMLNTGSRASIYSVIFFFLTLACIKLYYRSKKTLKLIVKFLIVIGLITVIAFVYSITQNNWEFLSRWTSGRVDGWIYDLSKMRQDNTLLFGYGLYNPTSFFSQPFSKGMIIDNWFVYMIINIGIVGFIGCMMEISFIGYKLLRIENVLKNEVLALFLANLVHAMAEKAFITPADPISFFMMVIIFATLYGKDSKE